MNENRLAFAGLILAAALVLEAGSSLSEASDSAIERLRDGEPLNCEAAYRFFCANIHFSCTGHSDVRARDLTVSVVEGVGKVEPLAGDPSVGGSAEAAYGDAGDYLLLRLAPEGDYFRIEDDGRYSHRIYRRGKAWMMRGRCR